MNHTFNIRNYLYYIYKLYMNHTFNIRNNEKYNETGSK